MQPPDQHSDMVTVAVIETYLAIKQRIKAFEELGKEGRLHEMSRYLDDVNGPQAA